MGGEEGSEKQRRSQRHKHGTPKLHKGDDAERAGEKENKKMRLRERVTRREHQEGEGEATCLHDELWNHITVASHWAANSPNQIFGINRGMERQSGIIGKVGGPNGESMQSGSRSRQNAQLAFTMKFGSKSRWLHWTSTLQGCPWGRQLRQ